MNEIPSAYLKRMWVDTAMPHSLTIRMALDFYGTERVFYGSDNPCWNPTGALEAVQALDLPADVLDAVLGQNVRRFLNLAPASVPAGRS